MDTFQGGILKQNEQRDKIKQKKNAKNITLKKQGFFFYSVVAYISLHIDTADTNVRV